MKLRESDRTAEEGVSHDPDIRKRVLLRAGEVAGVTAVSRSRLEPGQATRPHRHPDMSEIYLVLAGSGCIHVDGQAHPLREGTCVAVEPDELHSVENTGQAPLELLYIGVQA